MAAFCLFVAGEEISWGHRLAGYQPPEIFLSRNYQQESNLHNLLKDIFDSRWQVFLIAMGYGVMAPIARWRRWLPSAWAPHPAVVPGAVVVLSIELAYPLELSGEIAELALGGVFLQDALMRFGEGKPSPSHQLLSCALCVTLGVVTPPTLDRLVYSTSDVRVDLARTELETLAAHLLEGGVTSRLTGRRRVHKRLFTAAKVGYVRLPPVTEATHEEADARRARYQLDPWQQPYWILLTTRNRDRPALVLYSFGPNRRRDSLLDDAPPGDPFIAGDDVAVHVELDTAKSRPDPRPIPGPTRQR
ncbi:MAG: hypothetical protein RIF41_35670 [Polyangiaceae bacterium]